MFEELSIVVFIFVFVVTVFWVVSKLESWDDSKTHVDISEYCGWSSYKIKLNLKQLKSFIALKEVTFCKYLSDTFLLEVASKEEIYYLDLTFRAFLYAQKYFKNLKKRKQINEENKNQIHFLETMQYCVDKEKEAYYKSLNKANKIVEGVLERCKESSCSMV